VVETKRTMTVEEFAKLPTGRGRRYELVHGELRTMAAAGGRHGAIVGQTTGVLWAFLTANDLGVLFGAETGFVLERNPDHVRAPDVAFVSYARLAEVTSRVGFLECAPDLVVEVISPGDAWSEVTEKVRDWLDHGTSVVWVVDPDARSVEIWRGNGRVDRRRGDEELDCEPALPGFRCKTVEIFPRLPSGF
jgi:Uma2 family endonuclease